MLTFKEKMFDTLDEKYITIDEPMKKHTTFRIGGNADYYVKISTIEDLQAVVTLCGRENIPFYIIGNGSNLLVGDGGYRGVIIEIAGGMNQVIYEAEHISAQAGALLSKVAKIALDNQLAGMEFAAGIPGTIGGAVVMNAGAYGGEMKDIISSVTVINQAGEMKELALEELEFGYRKSVISEMNYIVVEVKLKLAKGIYQDIQKRMDELKEQRVTKQPLEYPSAGSTFKRPEGYFAAKLIDDTKLRGVQVGGAQVSEKHCGFVINVGDATAKDVMKLIAKVQERVYQEQGVMLEPEIKRIGEF